MQGVEELPRVGGVALPIQQAAQPGHVVDIGLAALAAAALFLVFPVGRYAVFGATVHGVGADLDLDGLALRPDDRRVQRLIHVELRHRDVVLEPAGNRVPLGMHRAECGIAVANVLDEDPHRDEVEDLLELALARHHLLIDRPIVLGSPGDCRLDARRLEHLGDLGPDRIEVFLASRCVGADELDDVVVALGIQSGEREVFQLPLDGVHPEAVSQRRVDLQGFLGLANGALAWEVLPRAGVVQPVGELDDEHPDVARHRDDHLADCLGLGGIAPRDLVELGHPVDELGDLVAEVGAELVKGVVGVFHRVVQQRCRDGVGGHPDLGEDLRDSERVGDVGVTADPNLTLVRRLGHVEGPQDHPDVGP